MLQLLTALAKIPMSSGNWCVSMASMAVKEQRPAVKRMKNGSSFFGYTDTSWNAAEGSPDVSIADTSHELKLLNVQGSSSLSAVSVHPGYG